MKDIKELFDDANKILSKPTLMLLEYTSSSKYVFKQSSAVKFNDDIPDFPEFSVYHVAFVGTAYALYCAIVEKQSAKVLEIKADLLALIDKFRSAALKRGGWRWKSIALDLAEARRRANGIKDKWPDSNSVIDSFFKAEYIMKSVFYTGSLFNSSIFFESRTRDKDRGQLTKFIPLIQVMIEGISTLDYEEDIPKDFKMMTDEILNMLARNTIFCVREKAGLVLEGLRAVQAQLAFMACPEMTHGYDNGPEPYLKAVYEFYQTYANTSQANTNLSECLKPLYHDDKERDLLDIMSIDIDRLADAIANAIYESVKSENVEEVKQ